MFASNECLPPGEIPLRELGLRHVRAGFRQFVLHRPLAFPSASVGTIPGKVYMRLRSTDISARTLGDETIVLSLSTSRYFTITGIGTRVFELLAEDTSLDELVGTIVDEYEVDPAIASRDIEAFLDRLRDAQLLH